jgi:hypothetical protein
MKLRAMLLSALGEDGFVALTKQLGGRRIYVPVRPRGDDALVRVIGLERAAKLSRVLGGEKLAVPMLAGQHRRTEILKWKSRGLSCHAIAVNLGCTVRWVQRVIAGDRSQVP